jgi:hypothetical protein
VERSLGKSPGFNLSTIFYGSAQGNFIFRALPVRNAKVKSDRFLNPRFTPSLYAYVFSREYSAWTPFIAFSARIKLAIATVLVFRLRSFNVSESHCSRIRGVNVGLFSRYNGTVQY